MQTDRVLALRNDLLSMVASVKHLSFTTAFDAVPEIVELHRSERCDDTSIEDAIRAANLDLDAKEFARQKLRLVLRERAKRPWLKYPIYRELFLDAYRRWLRTRQIDALNSFGRSAIATPLEPGTPLWIKERDVRTLIGLQIEWALPVTNGAPLPMYLDMGNDIMLRALVASGMEPPSTDKDDDLMEEYLLVLQSSNF